MLDGFTISRMENVRVVTIGEYFCHSICSSGPGLNFNFEPAWVPTKQGDLNWNLASGPTSIRETRVCMVAQSTHVLLSIIYSCFVNGLRLACYMLPLMLGCFTSVHLPKYPSKSVMSWNGLLTATMVIHGTYLVSTDR